MKKIFFIIVAFFFNNSANAKILAKSWLIADGNGNIIQQENAEIVQPIASITKLMTAIVVLDNNENLEETFTMRKFKGMKVTRRQLLDLAIIHSDNTAADMLCKNYRKGYHSCIADMNYKALLLGMNNTKFFDSTGLDNRNVSNAVDLIKLLQTAEKYPVITNASSQTLIQLIKKRNRWKLSNTNPLVAKYNVIVSKTGYVRLSGGCLVMSVMIDNQKKLFVVLNSKTTRTRIHDMEQLVLSSVTGKDL